MKILFNLLNADRRLFVIPAKAGTQGGSYTQPNPWTPASAG